jgi:hypothetical protein
MKFNRFCEQLIHNGRYSNNYVSQGSFLLFDALEGPYHLPSNLIVFDALDFLIKANINGEDQFRNILATALHQLFAGLILEWCKRLFALVKRKKFYLY